MTGEAGDEVLEAGCIADVEELAGCNGCLRRRQYRSCGVKLLLDEFLAEQVVSINIGSTLKFSSDREVEASISDGLPGVRRVFDQHQPPHKGTSQVAKRAFTEGGPEI